PGARMRVYALRSAMRNGETLVPVPRQRGNSPVANVSGVPRCPILSTASLFFATRTISEDEKPSGLSTNRMPFNRDTTILSRRSAEADFPDGSLFPGWCRRGTANPAYDAGACAQQFGA